MKKLLSLFMVFVLIFALSVPAFADEPELDYVTDAAQLLTEDEWESLEKMAIQLSEEYQCSVYIVTVDDYQDFTASGRVEDAAMAIYDAYNLGWGTQKSGVMLLLSLQDRDYTIIANGMGNIAFTDYGKDRLAEKFLDNFENNDWYGGFADYLQKCSDMLALAKEGKPLDVNSNPLVFWAGILFSILFGTGIAIAICMVLRKNMKSVATGSEAENYLNGTVNFAVREDQYTHTTQTRVKIEKKSSGDGHGGTTVNSGGFSSKNGKF